METNVPPLIIPMWLTGTDLRCQRFLQLVHICTGFDKLMPEHRPFPYKYLPKMGIQLSVTFGDPIPPDKIIVALNAMRRLKPSYSPPGLVENSTRHNGPPSRSGFSSALHVGGWIKDTIIQTGGDPIEVYEGAGRCAQMDEIRSDVTAIIQQAVEDLGRKVSGSKLDLPLHH